MRQRLPLILSATALLVALFGATPLGTAAEKAIRSIPPFAKKAGYANKAGLALNANKLNGHTSATNPTAGEIPVLGRNGKLAASIGAVGSPGPPGPKGDPGTALANRIVAAKDSFASLLVIPGLAELAIKCNSAGGASWRWTNMSAASVLGYGGSFGSIDGYNIVLDPGQSYEQALPGTGPWALTFQVGSGTGTSSRMVTVVAGLQNATGVPCHSEAQAVATNL